MPDIDRDTCLRAARECVGRAADLLILADAWDEAREAIRLGQTLDHALRGDVDDDQQAVVEAARGRS